MPSGPRTPAPKKQSPLSYSWAVTVALRGVDVPFHSVQVVAPTLETACAAVLDHCGAPGLDLEVTAALRLPGGVINGAKRGKAA